MKRLLFLVLAFGIIGCAHAQYQAHMNLQLGMKKQQVLSVLGPPPVRELYKRADRLLIEYLIYTDFQPYEESTPICFINDRVVGWGTTFYQDHVKSDDVRLK
jgi:hypothetical protein